MHELQSLECVGEHLKVLYIEDSIVVRESTLDMLEEYFLHVDTAINGEEGFYQYKKFYEKYSLYYDIVVTDINMPKMNGIEMSELILQINDEQNILIISAHNESDYLLELINMGVSNFVLKPIEIKKFHKTIGRIISAVLNQKSVIRHQNELKELNIVLQSAKEEAEQASLLKGQFLANMSHEIRTPLNAITGFISLLNEKETDLEKLGYLKVIKNSSDSLLQIINDILDISKIESGKLEIDPINFNPYDDLITVAELFQSKAAEKGVILKILYNTTMPKILYGDSLRIKQILSNLLSNAVKFTSKGSMVKCIVWYAKGRLNIRVKDYGIGINASKHETVFESFSQAEGSTVREYGGTGLGLAISAKLTELIGGDLTLKSREGEGSVFLLTLRIQLGKQLQEKAVSSNQKSVSLKGNLLLVEDNEANRMFVGIILNNIGVTYETANNGLEAIEKFKTGKYDLILMDENMPRLGGIAATKIILQIEHQYDLPHTPVVSLTANALKGDKERFLAAGMDGYLSKPIEPKILIETIRTFLNRDDKT